MIVLDASAALEILLRGAAAGAVEARAFAPGETIHAPHLIDLEVAQGLRRHVIAGLMSSEHGDGALDIWRDFPVRRWGHEAMLRRVWALRKNLTAYDAAYVALAETLDATLLTTDAKLARAPGHAARVDVVG